MNNKIDKTILKVRDLTMRKDFSSSLTKKWSPFVKDSKIITRSRI